MLKLPLTFEDPFTEETVTEVAYFHLSKLECVELETSIPGGLGNKFKDLGEKDLDKILEFFKILVSKAYGTKDGARFYKSPEETARFLGSPAYEVMFFKLMTDAAFNTKFIREVMPKGLFDAEGNIKSSEEIYAVVRGQAEAEAAALEEPEKPADWYPWADREPTQKELITMSAEQLRHVYQRRSQGWTPKS